MACVSPSFVPAGGALSDGLEGHCFQVARNKSLVRASCQIFASRSGRSGTLFISAALPCSGFVWHDLSSCWNTNTLYYYLHSVLTVALLWLAQEKRSRHPATVLWRLEARTARRLDRKAKPKSTLQFMV